MADVRRSGSANAGFSPDAVAQHGFPTSFRGFDTEQVREYLQQVADELRAAFERESELRLRLKDAEQRAAHPKIDDATLTTALGEETARVLQSAHAASHDIKQKAEDGVAQVLRDAHEEAMRIRAAAESILARETEEAERVAAQMRSAAEADAAAALGRARKEAEGLLEDVQVGARQMVEEAQAARAKVLGDLARRRRIAATQVEQLRAGRDRLLEAYRVVRTTLDEVTSELQKAESEARQAAEAVATRMAADAAPSLATPTDAGDAGDAGDEGLSADVADDFSPAAETEVLAVPDRSQIEVRGPAPKSTLIVTTPGATVERPAPAPAPVSPRVPAGPGHDDRRLSSLRIIRRSKDDARRDKDENPTEAPPVVETRAGLDVVQQPSTEEGIRLLEPESETQADDTIAPEAPAPAAPVALAGDEAVSETEVGELFARIRADRARAVKEARETLAEDPAPTAASGELEVAEAETVEVRDEEEQLLQRRDSVVEDIQLRLARRIKRALQDEQNDVLDRLRLQRGRPAAAAVLPPEPEQRERYRAIAIELMVEGAGAGREFAGGGGASAADVDDLATALSTELVDALRRRLERAIDDGPDDDAGLIGERIGGAYRETKSQRAERLAADHIIAAFSRGTFLAEGEGAFHRWVVDDEGAPCPDCDDNALAGATPRGTEFPTGQLHPPAHAGCRCLLVPAPT